MRESSRLVITADDSTGALETAAACAEFGRRPWVITPSSGPFERDDEVDLVVVDLRSRHLPAAAAAARIRTVVERASGFRAHKIDSTLRGNWAHEVAAIVEGGRPVLLVAAFPAAGRTCVDGTVLVHGVPVHETAVAHDPRSPVRWSRPVDRLDGAVAARDAVAAASAFADGARIVVADAVTDDDIAALAAFAAEQPEAVLVGPAAVIASLVARLTDLTGAGRHGTARSSAGSPRRRGVSRPTSSPSPPFLVVSASQHPIAAAQFAHLAHLAVRGVEVIRPPADARAEDAELVLGRLADQVHARLAADPGIATLVVVGGDTTAAVIGDASVRVDGLLGTGIAVGSVVLGGRRLGLVTKPGGFGAASTLVDVLHDALQHPDGTEQLDHTDGVDG